MSVSCVRATGLGTTTKLTNQGEESDNNDTQGHADGTRVRLGRVVDELNVRDSGRSS